jgi:hypothetical protein
MTRSLLLFACLGLMVTALGCRCCTRHGVCDCDAPPAAYGHYGVYGHDAYHGGSHQHIDPVPDTPTPDAPTPEPGN